MIKNHNSILNKLLGSQPYWTNNRQLALVMYCHKSRLT